MEKETKLRQQLLDAALHMSRSGLSPGRSGNVSARFDQGFLITASGLSYEEMCIEDLVFVDAQGESRHSFLQPSSEWRFHHDIYHRFPEAGAIVHCHSRHATALACDNCEIPAFHYMVAVAGGRKIPLAPYALFGTQALSDHVTGALDGVRACLLAHHGLVAYGADVASALELAFEVEELAAQYVLVRGLGSTRLLSDRQMDEVIERFKTYGSAAKGEHREKGNRA